MRLWENLRWLAPIAAFVLPYPIARLLGGFGAGFQFIGQEVSPVEAFGILGTRIDTSEVSQKVAYRSGRYWALDVRYRYRVGGVDYVGTQLAFAPRWLGSRDTVDALARRYGAGASVEVRYDPDQPAEAILETDDQRAAQRLFAVWVCLFVVAVGVIVLALRRAFT